MPRNAAQRPTRRCALPLAAALLLAAACHDDGENPSRTFQQAECQQRCEETYAAQLAHPDCIACAVTCLLADDARSYQCRFDTCLPDRCAAHCQDDDAYPIGLCNHAADEGVYWGCQCFAVE
ncbi:MAG: hypothetical protein GX146_00750 [Myxococcales bacterium]|jgi:hypothetical protein|nr:hypothetical protein [Myxococcales bacterium]